MKDIVLPEGVKAIADGEITAFLVSEPSVAVEPAAEAPAAPEVIKEKKPEAEAAKK